MNKRRTHSLEFKAKVAMEAISGRKTIQEIAANHGIHPIQVSQWKKQRLVDLNQITAVDQICATDITTIPLQKGFLYLVAIVDLFIQERAQLEALQQP